MVHKAPDSKESNITMARSQREDLTNGIMGLNVGIPSEHVLEALLGFGLVGMCRNTQGHGACAMSGSFDLPESLLACDPLASKLIEKILSSSLVATSSQCCVSGIQLSAEAKRGVELCFPTNPKLAQFNWLKRQGWECQGDRDAGKIETRCWSVPSSGGGDLNLFASWRLDPPKLHFLQLKNCPTVSLLFAHLGDPSTIVSGLSFLYECILASVLRVWISEAGIHFFYF